MTNYFENFCRGISRIEPHSLLFGICGGLLLAHSISYLSLTDVNDARFLNQEQNVLQLSRPIGYGRLLYQDSNDRNHFVSENRKLVGSVEAEENLQSSSHKR